MNTFVLYLPPSTHIVPSSRRPFAEPSYAQVGIPTRVDLQTNWNQERFYAK